MCTNQDTVDVGRGTGSCNTNCDCPGCAPFCSNSGFCQTTSSSGQTPCHNRPSTACTDQDRVDVGRGTGSCNTNCDCPGCAPFCSNAGFCQTTASSGQTPCLNRPTTPATCPPLLGDPAPAGCTDYFIQDRYGLISCQSDAHCPWVTIPAIF